MHLCFFSILKRNEKSVFSRSESFVVLRKADVSASFLFGCLFSIILILQHCGHQIYIYIWLSEHLRLTKTKTSQRVYKG